MGDVCTPRLCSPATREVKGTSTRTLHFSRSRAPPTRRRLAGMWARGAPTSTRPRTRPPFPDRLRSHEVYLGQGDPPSWKRWFRARQVRSQPSSPGHGTEGQNHDVPQQDLDSAFLCNFQTCLKYTGNFELFSLLVS